MVYWFQSPRPRLDDCWAYVFLLLLVSRFSVVKLIANLVILFLARTIRHNFTANFLCDLRCGYCHAGTESLYLSFLILLLTLLFTSASGPFENIHDLQEHLTDSQGPDHPVYACCGKLFQVQAHLHQHLDARTNANHYPIGD